MKRIGLFLGSVLVTLQISAQSLSSAIQYTETFAGGTARSTAMAGAYGALGADFASASQNPAGLAFYRSSEVTFTPEFYYSKSNTKYFGASEIDDKLNFNINNFGYIGAYAKDKTKGFSGFVFSVGYNRINNYHNNVLFEGINQNSSLVDFYTATANTANNGFPALEENLDPFSEKLFWEGYLFDYDIDDEQYYVYDDVYLPVIQRRQIESRGKMDEWAISFAGNYSHVFYFGATFGIRSLYFNQYTYHSEYDEWYPDFKYFTFTQSVHEDGVGYTGKLGVILKPINELRLGASLHLPAVYFIDREEDADLRSAFTDPANYQIIPTYSENDIAGPLAYSYRLTSPAKFVGSAAAVLGKLALVSVDVEYTDYSQMRFSNASDGFNYSYWNEDLQAIHKSAVNIKSGVEFRLDPMRLRAGFGYYDSPYSTGEINEDSYTLTYSGGFGYREKHFFFDFAYMYQSRDDAYILYILNNNVNQADIENRKSRFLLTFGFRF